MPYTPSTDIHEILTALNPFIESQTEGSKAREALELAQIALLYIRDTKAQEDFARYCRKFSTEPFTVAVSHEFPTREEAERWLSSGNAMDSERVKIAGKGFMVVQATGRLLLMVAPLPEELESEE